MTKRRDDTPEAASFDSQNVFFEMDCPISRGLHRGFHRGGIFWQLYPLFSPIMNGLHNGLKVLSLLSKFVLDAHRNLRINYALNHPLNLKLAQAITENTIREAFYCSS